MLFVYLLKCEIDVEMFFGLEQLEHIICRRRRRCRHSSRSTSNMSIQTTTMMMMMVAMLTTYVNVCA